MIMRNVILVVLVTLVGLPLANAQNRYNDIVEMRLFKAFRVIGLDGDLLCVELYDNESRSSRIYGFVRGELTLQVDNVRGACLQRFGSHLDLVVYYSEAGTRGYTFDRIDPKSGEIKESKSGLFSDFSVMSIRSTEFDGVLLVQAYDAAALWDVESDLFSFVGWDSARFLKTTDWIPYDQMRKKFELQFQDDSRWEIGNCGVTKDGLWFLLDGDAPVFEYIPFLSTTDRGCDRRWLLDSGRAVSTSLSFRVTYTDEHDYRAHPDVCWVGVDRTTGHLSAFYWLNKDSEVLALRPDLVTVLYRREWDPISNEWIDELGEIRAIGRMVDLDYWDRRLIMITRQSYEPPVADGLDSQRKPDEIGRQFRVTPFPKVQSAGPMVSELPDDSPARFVPFEDKVIMSWECGDNLNFSVAKYGKHDDWWDWQDIGTVPLDEFLTTWIREMRR